MISVVAIHAEFQRRLGSLGAVVVAGGSVRDELMGRTPKDFDVFVIGLPFTAESAQAVRDTCVDVPSIEALDFHKSEPFLAVSLNWNGVMVQIMCSPLTSTAVLLDSFDWNVSRFAFDGSCHALEDIANIVEGKPLRLHRVTYPASTLRRGFRFSERFGMKFEHADLVDLCRRVSKEGEV